MTYEQIERIVESRTNAADNALMSGRMTQKQYDLHMRALNRWADRKMERAAYGPPIIRRLTSDLRQLENAQPRR
jgi:hypothetical protein